MSVGENGVASLAESPALGGGGETVAAMAFMGQRDKTMAKAMALMFMQNATLTSYRHLLEVSCTVSPALNSTTLLQGSWPGSVIVTL